MLVLVIRVHCILLTLKPKNRNKLWLNFIKKSVYIRLDSWFILTESKGCNNSLRHNLNLKG
jgi:hypothetical protein